MPKFVYVDRNTKCTTENAISSLSASFLTILAFIACFLGKNYF